MGDLTDQGWTFPTLRLLLENQIAAADRRYEQRHEHNLRESAARDAAAAESLRAALAGIHNAIEKQDAALNQRFESVNEFRQAMLDQASHFATRVEADARHADVLGQLGKIFSRLDGLDGANRGMARLWALILGGIGLLALLADLAIRAREGFR